MFVPFILTDTSCGQFLTGPSGTVMSANYPGNYNNDEYCTWQIQVPVNKKIRLDFTEFKTETGKDYLLIYDTSHYQTPTIVFDGTTYKPPPFTSSGNVVRVRFISDGATSMRGFSFNFKQVGKNKFYYVTIHRPISLSEPVMSVSSPLAVISRLLKMDFKLKVLQVITTKLCKFT